MTRWLRIALVAGVVAAVVGLAALARALDAFEIPDDLFGDWTAVPADFNFRGP